MIYFRSLLSALLLGLLAAPSFAQTAAPADAAPKVDEARAKSDVAADARAAEWVGSLTLNDAAREGRLQAVVATHLKAVRDWYNDHPASNVPAGINPTTGKPLSEQDRKIIADSAMPKSVHTALMTGLRQDLSEPQVEAILDKYTQGKVAFTLKGYHAIVPDLTPKEEETILGFLKQAREQAVDFKNIKQISAIFEIYKTKSEQYLNSQGRDWHALFKAYVDAVQAKKKADAAAKK